MYICIVANSPVQRFLYIGVHLICVSFLEMSCTVHMYVDLLQVSGNINLIFLNYEQSFFQL
jgi:hypothetical protein